MQPTLKQTHLESNFKKFATTYKSIIVEKGRQQRYLGTQVATTIHKHHGKKWHVL